MKGNPPTPQPHPTQSQERVVFYFPHSWLSLSTPWSELYFLELLGSPIPPRVTTSTFCAVRLGFFRLCFFFVNGEFARGPLPDFHALLTDFFFTFLQHSDALLLLYFSDFRRSLAFPQLSLATDICCRHPPSRILCFISCRVALP